jgi:molybdopterin-guanine dinucleotide biosynthesis adapter protein
VFCFLDWCVWLVLLVAAVGVSGSGKTVTIEYLTGKLSVEGYCVGNIKHIHHKGFTIDKEGTNTWRYAQAGSKVIVAVSPEEVDVIKKTETELADLDQILALLKDEELDVIFIEGFHGVIGKREDVLKIITAKDEAAIDETLKGTVGPVIAISGVATNTLTQTEYRKIPIVRLPQDGEKLLSLIKKYLQN